MPKSFKKSKKYKKVTVRVPAKKTGKGKHKGYTKTVYKLKKK
jgi:hypothetical protein